MTKAQLINKFYDKQVEFHELQKLTGDSNFHMFKEPKTKSTKFQIECMIDTIQREIDKLEKIVCDEVQAEIDLIQGEV